jgi:hypothetical protein
MTILPALLHMTLLSSTHGQPTMRQPIHGTTNQVLEQTFTSEKRYADPFNDVEVTVQVTRPDGKRQDVPAFWAGGQMWKVRYASEKPGKYTYRSTCTDASNAALNGATGSFEISGYRGSNPLYKHGPVRIAGDRRHFEYADGTPFFWLGDTWWMSLTKRLHWPEEFQQLSSDRVKKGYTVIQIVAGLYPDMPPFDERGANEAGFPWTKDYGQINPEYFDLADRRIQSLVDSGLSPCIVGAWGYFMPWMGVEKLDKHWRYLVARYGAYPVFWCVAGEANLPYYLTKGFPFDDREQVKGWTKVASYIKSIDPYHRPLSIHPTGLGKLDARHAIDEVSLLDFDMLQTGHGDRSSLPPTVDAARAAYAGIPHMPYLNSEVCYEGILNSCHDDVQRLMFWSCMLSGAAGHTYGANGIWQLNRRDKAYGNSPHGGNYGPTPWDVAMNLPGSGQLGRSKAFLMRLPWTKFEPHPEWASFANADRAVWGDWIWYPEGDPTKDAPVAPRYFRRLFTLPANRPVSRAILRVAADDRHTAYFNGTKVGSGNGWSAVQDVNVTKLLRPGQNVVAIMGENMKAPVQKNPAGMLCTLSIQYKDGSTENILSDTTWKAQNRLETGWETATFNDGSWPSAMRAAPYGGGPWGRIADSQPYLTPYAAGVPGGVRVIYLPLPQNVEVKNLKAGAQYRMELFDPASGKSGKLGVGTAGGSGALSVPAPEGASDWVLVLRPEGK